MGTLTTIPCNPCCLSLSRDLMFMNSCLGDTNLCSITIRPDSSEGISGKVKPRHNAILGTLQFLMSMRQFLHTYCMLPDLKRKKPRDKF